MKGRLQSLRNCDKSSDEGKFLFQKYFDFREQKCAFPFAARYKNIFEKNQRRVNRNGDFILELDCYEVATVVQNADNTFSSPPLYTLVPLARYKFRVEFSDSIALKSNKRI